MTLQVRTLPHTESRGWEGLEAGKNQEESGPVTNIAGCYAASIHSGRLSILVYMRLVTGLNVFNLNH